MDQNRRYDNLLLLAVLVFLFIIRVANLHILGLFDYDAVNNFTIIQKIAAGDFSKFYNHSSPLFYLIFTPFYKLIGNYTFLAYIHAGFNVLALWIFIDFFGRELKISKVRQAVILLLSGSGLVFFASARYFSTESLSLPFFNISLIFFYKCFKKKYQLNSWLIAWFCLGLSFTINYKQAYFIVFFALYVILKHRQILHSKFIGLGIFTVCIPTLLMLLIGWANGHSLMAYPKQILMQSILRNVNPYADVTPIRGDFWFYPAYIFRFEVGFTLLLINLSIGILTKKINVSAFNQNKTIQFLLTVCLPYIIIMSFLQKAPRALIPIYLPITFVLYYFSNKILQTKIIVPLLSLAILLQLYIIRTEFYHNLPSGYAKVAQFIKQNNISRLASTSSKNIVPFLEKNIEVKIIFHQNELSEIKTAGFEYLLVDTYYLAAHPENYKLLKTKDAVLRAQEPVLLNHLLFLEHSEYNGLSFSESIQNFEKMSNLSYQLYLLELNHDQRIK